MKIKFPKVSFIMPTLNASKYLPKSLKAIRHQDYPQNKIEIVIADGGSTDDTLKIAKKYKAKVIKNPEVLHEPGKDRASKVASGEIFFYTDADNVLENNNWVSSMVKPYIENKGIVGFLPQTVPPKNWNSFDRYMGYLSTDPFTWFVYRWSATPRTYGSLYKPVKKTKDYKIYKFNVENHPLLGLSQGFGTISSFNRKKIGHADDILSGIKLIADGGLIVFVPNAKVFHYHVHGLEDFINKYTWRMRNNLYQKVKGMGLVNRQRYLNSSRRLRQYLFIPYSLSIVLPTIDGLRLYKFYKDPVLLWHPIACIILSLIMIKELLFFLFGFKKEPGTYGKS